MGSCAQLPLEFRSERMNVACCRGGPGRAAPCPATHSRGRSKGQRELARRDPDYSIPATWPGDASLPCFLKEALEVPTAVPGAHVANGPALFSAGEGKRTCPILRSHRSTASFGTLLEHRYTDLTLDLPNRDLCSGAQESVLQ